MHEAVPAIASCGVSPLVRIPDMQGWMIKSKFRGQAEQVDAADIWIRGTRCRSTRCRFMGKKRETKSADEVDFGPAAPLRG